MIASVEPFDLVVRSERALVDDEGTPRPTAAAVGVRDGRIAAILAVDAPVTAAEEVTLGADEVLVPGLVDTHVHVNEPGRTEWEGFASATRAAAAGGVTTVLDMPLNSVPPTTTVEALCVKQEAARGQIAVDVGFWGGAVPENLAHLGPLHDAGVFGFKCFLVDSGVAEFGHLEPPAFAVAMEATARLGALMIVHAEDAAHLIEAAADGPSYPGFLASRPTASENEAIGRVIAEARRTGARAHIVHLSSAEAVPALHDARAAGVDISVETCPHYLYFDAADVPDGGTEFKCCPPIRDADNRDRLWQALADGDIDFVVSDHSPSTPDLKHAPGGPGAGDFGQAWGGIAGLQVSFPAVWTAAASRGVPLEQVVAWMATASADRVGLTQKGRLAEGADADLVVLAPDAEFTVDVAALSHKNPVSAYAGRRLRGVVRRTYLRGTPVDPSRPQGRLLQRAGTGGRKGQS
jgi:allantoinase